MTYEKQPGVPRFEAQEYGAKSKDFVLLIPIINEGNRIHQELRRAGWTVWWILSSATAAPKMALPQKRH